jgi:hypothetical protein
MDRKIDEEIASIERTQRELRDSIERAKELTEDADKMLKEHKKTLENEPPNGD